MKTTLNKIPQHRLYKGGWEKLLAYLGKTKADDEQAQPVGLVKDLFTQAAWEKLDVRGSTEVYLAHPCKGSHTGASMSAKVGQVDTPHDYPEPLSEFQEGQWWMKELDKLSAHPSYKPLEIPDDMRRAVSVVHHLLKAARITEQIKDQHLLKAARITEQIKDQQAIIHRLQKRHAELEGQVGSPASTYGSTNFDGIREWSGWTGTDDEIRAQLRALFAEATKLRRNPMMYFETNKPHIAVWPYLAFGTKEGRWIGLGWLNFELGWRWGK